MSGPHRPPPPYRAPYGSTWVPAVESPHAWRVDTSRRCHYVTGPKGANCGAASIVANNRSHRPQVMWWGFCEQHMYTFGRWLTDGRVWSWRLVNSADADQPDYRTGQAGTP